jgi:CDP-4-dehydro-6-deoxyglucose reductase
MHHVLLTTGQKFEAREKENLLDAAAQAGILLPYSCKTGRCSTCKCKLIGGETRALHPETGLTEQEKKEGWILSCVRSAETNITLEAVDLGEVVLPAIKTLPCRISHLELLAPDVIQVNLRLPPTAEFSFIPGQYIIVIGPDGIRRSYSLANFSAADNVLELHIRAIAGGVMSEYWFKQAKINDLLRLNGPLGTFFLRDVAYLDLVFLATGTGLAPVKAILQSLRDLTGDRAPRSVTVFWGGRVPTDLYFDVPSIAGKFEYVPVLSRPGTAWSGARGHVQQAFLAKGTNLRQAMVYACGSDAMIHSAKELLVKNGLPIKRFYSDAFVCSSSE